MKKENVKTDVCPDCFLIKGDIQIEYDKVECDPWAHWNDVFDSNDRQVGFQCRTCGAIWPVEIYYIN